MFLYKVKTLDFKQCSFQLVVGMQIFVAVVANHFLLNYCSERTKENKALGFSWKGVQVVKEMTLFFSLESGCSPIPGKGQERKHR